MNSVSLIRLVTFHLHLLSKWPPPKMSSITYSSSFYSPAGEEVMTNVRSCQQLFYVSFTSWYVIIGGHGLVPPNQATHCDTSFQFMKVINVLQQQLNNVHPLSIGTIDCPESRNSLLINHFSCLWQLDEINHLWTRKWIKYGIKPIN